MFGIGSTELLVILLVGLIVLGPKSLASLSRTIGKMVGEFRRVSTDFQRTLNAEAAAEEEKEKAAGRSEAERQEAERRAAEDLERNTKLMARKEEALAKARRAKEARNSGPDDTTEAAVQKTEEPVATANSAAAPAPETPPAPPSDSPLARALEKTHAEASKSARPATETPNPTA